MTPPARAAGGVVAGPDGRVVVVCQQGRSWSLPKGHLEDGEEPRQAAEREITEESGLTDLRYVGALGSYTRSSISGTGTILPDRLKTIEMYLYSTGGGPLVPKDPDNPLAVWAEPAAAARLLTHPADADFLNSRVRQLPTGRPAGPAECPAHTAVILAAGLGSRLAPHTGPLPKACVPVGGTPLVVRTLDALHRAGIRRSVIVTGHLREVLTSTVRGLRPDYDVRFVVNEEYATTGTAVSLRTGLAALDPLDVPVVIEGDVVLDSAVLDRLLARPGSSTAVAAYRPGLSGSFMTLDSRQRATAISRADWREPDADVSGAYKTVNAHVFSHADLLGTVAPALARLTERQPDAHVEHLLRDCIDAGLSLAAVDVAGLRWYEVDDTADLAVAERLFAPAAARTEGR
ncbi:NTP transferase domain-containing protein [Streptomyces sp. NPDC005423]|uniref:NTP transferase domain-containing protein n=1 Tax=Streptomyces sp. NPDC005423 TaxID=3155343 RepID=UPI0033A3C141